MKNHDSFCSRPGPTKRRQLRALADQVTLLLVAAKSMGSVILVTNARRPWVENSSERFLPSLRDVLQNIPIMYALETQEEVKDTYDGDDLTQSKAAAMKSALTVFYSRYPDQSWKNVVSIGDARFEHDAIRQVTAEKQAETPGKKVRTKTVKLIEDPTLGSMMVQVSMIENWLAKIVKADYDVAIDFSDLDANMETWRDEFGRDCAVEPPEPNAEVRMGQSQDVFVL